MKGPMNTGNFKFDSLYRTFSPMVFRRCLALLKEEAEAFDVMQEVFVRVLTREDSLDLNAPSSLLWTSATRLCLNRIRDKTRRGLVDSTDALLPQIANLKDEFDGYERSNMFFQLFSGEPVSSRTIAVLHYVDGMTLEETAKEVGLSVSGVRKRLGSLQTKLKILEAVK